MPPSFLHAAAGTLHPAGMTGGRRYGALALAVGVGILASLVAWRGVDAVVEAMETAGWGVLWLVPLYLPPLLAASESWRVLYPRGGRLRFRLAAYLTWIGLAVNQLLPVGQVGGEMVKVRMLLHRGRDGRRGTATVVVDKTFQAATQAVYALLGLVLLGGAAAGRRMALGILAGTLLFGGAVYVFYRMQVGGLFGSVAGWLERAVPLARELELSGEAEEVDEQIRDIYADRLRLVGCFLWRMGFRTILAVEVLVVLALLGQPVDVLDALILESLGQAARAAAFAIPAGLGAQEGGLVVVGIALGLEPETALALSLAKRVRELGVGVPALLAWQAEEGRTVLAG